jgi:hypothetical protein
MARELSVFDTRLKTKWGWVGAEGANRKLANINLRVVISLDIRLINDHYTLRLFYIYLA